MTPSIRTFLLINLLLSVTLITSLAIIGNLFLEHKDLQNHLDAKITQSAFTIQAFITPLMESDNYHLIQNRINNIPNLQKLYFAEHKEPTLQPDYERIRFQVWSHDGKLLLHSLHEPHDSLFKQKLGLSDAWLDGEPWRLFATVDNATGAKIIVAEEYDFRNVLEGRITQDSIFIMLMTYPFLGILIWIIIGRGLDSLKKVTQEVRHRVPNYLRPVNLEHVPLEIKPLVDELNKLFIRLQEALDREKRFAADAAHELRTPLAALRTHTQVALNAATEDERKEALRKVLAGVDRSTHVVQQLLILSRMVPEANIEQTTTVNLVRQAQEVIAELAPEALNKNTEIELLDNTEHPNVPGNPVAISILIRNLVDNAIRYTPENSSVKVLLEENANYVKLIVIDNGPGIPVNLRKRVFERFFRVIGNKSPGSGLGLGIVQQIAELHKAVIELDSAESGKGLKFIVAFPKN